MLSSDVSAGYDPAYGEAFEKKNAAYLGRGIVLNKFTGARGKSGSNDANAEYVARVRNIFDSHEVAFQTAELGKVDVGGGGTIAYIAALYGMEVIDSGVAAVSYTHLYNAMVVSLEEMLKKNAAIQRETNKAKLLALQTQINPHFLANSFETIRALAIKSESYEVEKAADALAKMYRCV